MARSVPSTTTFPGVNEVAKTTYTKKDVDRVLAVLAAAISTGKLDEAKAMLASGKTPEEVLAILKPKEDSK